MDCKFHPGEETIDKCILCYTPICSRCIEKSKESDYNLLCPKCLKTMGLSMDCLFDVVNYQ